MSAGTGIRHSEMNNNDDMCYLEPLHNGFDITKRNFHANANNAAFYHLCTMQSEPDTILRLTQVALLTNLDQA